MKTTKREVIIGTGSFLVALLIASGWLGWHNHQQHEKHLSNTAAKTTDNPNIALGQTDSDPGGLSVSGQASNLGQLGGNGSQSQGSANGASSSAGGVDPSTFTQYDKYKNNKDALFGDIQAGNGPQLKAGQKANIYYKAWLTNGALVDRSPTSSSGQPQPYGFTLGAHQVIPGLEEGVYGMKAAGKRLIIVPPGVGYGSKGQGAVPPNAVLVFEVQLLNIR
jgi:hypothetical protein